MNCLKFSILSYLHHSLCIADDAGVIIAQHICYNLNLFESDSINNLELGVKTDISIDISNMWKDIHKMAYEKFNRCRYQAWQSLKCYLSF